ncbi:MAG: hypothetical protein KAJ98_09670, partial [Spirochaetaceae bacterium]|nr:hypothetical protein [Spirochaetaceae bacterium]
MGSEVSKNPFILNLSCNSVIFATTLFYSQAAPCRNRSDDLKTLRLFNSDGRELQDFTPLVSGHVGLYCCGPTVYNYAHIGNLRAYTHWDILRRTLERFGYDVKHVMNITDVG